VSSSTPHRFDDPIWPIRDVLGWVLDRDPAKFGRLYTEEDIKSALFRLNYTREARPERDPRVLTTVLHALQRGDLVAYDGTNSVRCDFWTDKTPRYIRGSADFLFRREDVLALWPDLRAQISRCPPPIRPLQGGQAAALVTKSEDHNRVPNWKIWKHIPDVKAYEAVALSLNIDPNKIRHSPHSWMADKQLFEEGEEFRERLFVVERNLEILGVRNYASEQYFNEDPVLRLSTFAGWAASIRWELPSELTELAAPASGSALPQPERADQEKAAESKPAPRRIAKQTKRDAVASWLAQRYPAGIPPGMSQKEIALQFEREKKVRVDTRTVRRALGGS
jgi:hypothetical protein